MLFYDSLTNFSISDFSPELFILCSLNCRILALMALFYAASCSALEIMVVLKFKVKINYQLLRGKTIIVLPMLG